MDRKLKRVSAFEPPILIIGSLLAVLSSIICMQIIGRVGVTPNTSLIGAIVAMIIARIPLEIFSSFKNLERQNLLQTSVSSAGFSAANCAFLSFGIFYIMGETRFLIPMAVGVFMGVVISIQVLGNIFDSSIFPAQEAWPPGVATSNTILAGDQGGEKGKRLIQGLLTGAFASYLGLPAAGIGIVFIANIYSMVALGTGLFLRGYSTLIFSMDLGSTYIPHGIMIGAGIMALIQSIMVITKKDNNNKKSFNLTVSASRTKIILTRSILAYIICSIVLALITGVNQRMVMSKVILWIIWSTISATSTMLLVGMAAMHSGWFPAFAITTIFMTIGIFLGFDDISLAVLTGFISSVGPCFADMGYDLKSGWILRGSGEDINREIHGRKQQVISETIGALIGIGVALLSMNIYFNHNIIPPVSKVFATTVQASADTSLIGTLIIWAIPGLILQLIGGNSNMLGVLFATGLLIDNPIYGIGVLIAVIARIIFGNKFMEIRDAGLIAGDGLYGFFSTLFQAIF